jgi:hypothetical protein
MKEKKEMPQRNTPGPSNGKRREREPIMNGSMHRFIVLVSIFCCVGLLLSGPVPAQTTFEEVAGVKWPPFGQYRSAAGDYDNDGRTDLFLTRYNSGRFTLLHAQGNGLLVDRTTILPMNLSGLKGGGAIFGDYDNDGDLDLYQPTGSLLNYRQDALLRNDRGVFRNVSLEAGLLDSLPTDNAIWLDYDQDGFLDLYTGHFLFTRALAIQSVDPPLRNKLYRNEGDGSFVDRTRESGLGLSMYPPPENTGSSFGMVAGDFNNDGWPDLYLSVWQGPNRLFLNNGQGGFRDATTSEIGDEGKALGVAVGDIDNDGDLDIFQASGGGISGAAGISTRSLMLLNLGEGQFLDVTEGVGLTPLFGLEVGLPRLADLDNDGDLDLSTAKTGQSDENEFSLLFLNNGDGIFEERTDRLGMEIGIIHWIWDYDQDGFLDIALLTDPRSSPHLKLYRNSGNAHHWLWVDPVGIQSNRDGIGARLNATTGDLEQTREIFGGDGYDQDELAAHFGLGEHARVNRLEIHWPSGQVDVLVDIPADQRIRVFEGREAYHVVHPTIWEKAPDVLVGGSTVDFKATVRPALFEAGAQITSITADLSQVGGPGEVPLVDEGDGTYQLETTFVVGSNSSKNVSILIEQSTSLGPYWTQLSKQLLVVPPEDLLIFSDAPADNWQLDPIRGLALNPAAETLVYQGQSALELQAEKSWIVDYLPGAPVNPIGYTSLRFAFHPGDALVPERSQLEVSINNLGKVVLLNGDIDDIGVDMDLKNWQIVEIPLDVFLAVKLGTPIERIRFSGNLEGTFYLDDIRLVAAAPPQPEDTAVLEEHSTTRPQSFTLEQNFPNPFNSSTLIHFALPQSDKVKLTVYNLMGQKVAALVEGIREAGTYTVHWDGRVDSGRELASGVYLYRLQAGGQTETRKLLLLR